MMGQYKAVIPTDRMYSKRHMWLQACSDEVNAATDGGNVYRVGFSAYSVRLLQDVYFLDWSIDEQTPVEDRREIGEIESSKAVSSMFAPCPGRVLKFNQGILDDPSAINVNNYGDGWLYTFETNETLLSPEEYIKVLEDGWEDTQRTIKGQMN